MRFFDLIEKFKFRFMNYEENDKIITYNIDKVNSISYLRTLKQHINFLKESFLLAQKRVIICSPFISYTNDFKSEINYHTLKEAIERNIDIYFVCSSRSEHLDDFKEYITDQQENVNHNVINKGIDLINRLFGLSLSMDNSENIKMREKIRIVEANNFHMKTIIIDDRIIAEGSFNYLSAIRNQYDKSHNHESSLVLEGDIAKKFINQFYQSEMGKMILNSTIK